MQDNNIAIQIKNVSKTYKNIKALDNVSLSIYDHEIFGLLGPNGSGKTTLLRILSTLVSPDNPSPDDSDGRSCKITGYDLLKEQAAVRQIMGYVPQQAALYVDLSALDNLILFNTPYNLDKQVQQERIDELLKMVDLYNRRHELVRTYSGGMLRRLSIICALVHQPKVLFLDEITVGLDTALRRELWDMIRQVKNTSTVVITTHYIPEAENYCDRVALMLQGHILDCGSPKELIKKYHTATDLEEVMLICEKKL
jgi:ABC-2 type transport system ATP-binding protein